MPAQTFSCPLMGAYHRMKDLLKPVPALGILACLPSGHPLFLDREPDNAFDENAIKVIIHTEDFSLTMYEPLEEACAPYGFSIDDLLAEPDWHIGYIAKEFAIHLAKIFDEQTPEYTAKLGFTTNEKGRNKPMVSISMEIGE